MQIKKIGLFLLLVLGFVSQAQAKDWKETVEGAKGETVYFNAWGGSSVINEYIAWVGKRLKQKYDVTVKHVKITDTALVVSRVLSEKKADVKQGGSVDAMWVNGKNFKTLKDNALLAESFVSDLPNNMYLDYDNKPLTKDFTVSTDGKEAPWGTAQLVFFYDSAVVKNPPRNPKQLLEWAKNNKGSFTYPKPPQFHGVTMLKQLLLTLNKDEINVFSKPVNKDTYEKYTKKLWAYLDVLHPYLWRAGKAFPMSTSAMLPLLDEGVLKMSISFNPYDADNNVRNGILPKSIRTYVWDTGTVGNVHFVAIPFNASSNDGARVLINFLMSPEAQARKANPKYWGDPTVLNIKTLGDKAKLFKDIKYGDSAPKTLGKVLGEPHPSWVTILEKEWLQRYSK